MATSSAHRVIMGKEEIQDFFCLWNFLLQKCLLSSPLRFVRLLSKFDWLSGRQKGSIFVKMFKNILLRNHMGDEAKTWHTC